MNSWDLEELRELIASERGANVLDAVDIHINSVAWKIELANYHKFAAHNAFAEIYKDSKNEIVEAVRLIINLNRNKSFSNAKIIAEANAIACAQSMYNVQDMLAYIIYHVFDLINYNGKKTLTDICKFIPAENVKKEAQKLIGSHKFLYLRDFSNQTKHVTLIHSGYNINLKDIDKKQHGMKFGSFSYETSNGSKVRQYKSKWYNDFLQDIDFIEKYYISIGVEINKFLKKKREAKKSEPNEPWKDKLR